MAFMKKFGKEKNLRYFVFTVTYLIVWNACGTVVVYILIYVIKSLSR